MDKRKIIAKCKQPRSFWIRREGEADVRRNIKHLKKSYTKAKYTVPNFDYIYEYNKKNCTNSPTQNKDPNVLQQPAGSVITRCGRVIKPRKFWIYDYFHLCSLFCIIV